MHYMMVLKYTLSSLVSVQAPQLVESTLGREHGSSLNPSGLLVYVGRDYASLLNTSRVHVMSGRD
jgi:hypothetical protein